MKSFRLEKSSGNASPFHGWQPWSWRRNILAVVIGVVVIAGVWHYQTHASAKIGAGDVALQSGADSCTSSGYELTNRLDGSTSTIYDCSFTSGLKCVTLANGIAHNVTAEVRLVWADTLGSAKPGCAL